MGEIKKGRSFGITSNPIYGMNDRLLYKILEWCEKISDYIYCITEKEGSERHAHIQIWTPKEKSIGDIKKQLDRIAEEDHKIEIVEWSKDCKKRCNKVKFAHNDWVEQYCNENELKKDEYEIIIDKYPINHDIEESYYPSEEEQQLIKNKANAKDKYLMELETMYLKDNNGEPPSHKMLVAMWLDTQCYQKRTLKASMLQRNRVELKTNLYYYMTKNTNGYAHSTKEEIKEHQDWENAKIEYEEKLIEDAKNENDEIWNSD